MLHIRVVINTLITKDSYYFEPEFANYDIIIGIVVSSFIIMHN